MSLNQRVRSLIDRRSDLKKALDRELARPSPNMTVIARIKKQNLILKDKQVSLLAQDQSAVSNRPNTA